MALGAEQGTVARLVMREKLRVILLGLAAGVLTAYFSADMWRQKLFRVRAMDLPVFRVSIAALLAASLFPSLAPAWRPSLISPMRALCYD